MARSRAVGKVKHSAVGAMRSVLACRFLTNGSSNPATVYGDGIASVTWVSTGKWKITFRESYYRVVALTTGLGLATSATNGNLNCQIDNESTPTPLEVIVNYTVAGTLTDLAANADNWLSVAVEVEESSCR